MTVLIDYTKGFFETIEGEGVGTVTGNATLDLSTGSVFSHTPTANTTFAFSNPPASGTASSATLKLTGANVVTGYDLANASYDSVSFSVGSQETFPSSLVFKPDGTKMFVVGYGNDAIFQYSLSTAWDVSSASYDSVSFSTSSQEAAPQGLFIKPDGTKFWITGNSDKVFQYSLSTAWDISTASYDSVSFATGTQIGLPVGVEFKSDGTKMYIIDIQGTQRVYQYSLSTAWDISTASYDSVSFSTSSQDTAPLDLTFNSDGTKMYMIGATTDAIYQYGLSTAWDLSSVSYDSVSFSVASQEATPRDVFFKPDGTKFYIVGDASDTVYQYTSGSSALATITYPSSVIWSGGTTPTTPANGETDVYTFYTDDGGTTYYGFQVGDALA
jgi:sugar lactone lactonase YvrE